MNQPFVTFQGMKRRKEGGGLGMENAKLNVHFSAL